MNHLFLKINKTLPKSKRYMYTILKVAYKKEQENVFNQLLRKVCVYNRNFLIFPNTDIVESFGWTYE